MKRMIGWGVFTVVLGLWIWLSALGVPYISFATNWPLLLVALGVWLIVRRLVRRSRRGRRRTDVLGDLEQGRIDVEKAITEIRRSR
jgi:hypothetical protein